MDDKTFKSKFNELTAPYITDQRIKNYSLLFFDFKNAITSLLDFIHTKDNKLTGIIKISYDYHNERSEKLIQGYNLLREKNKQTALNIINHTAAQKNELTNQYEQLKTNIKIINEQDLNLVNDQKNQVQQEYITKLKELTNEKNNFEKNYNQSMTQFENKKNEEELILHQELSIALDNYQSLKNEAVSGYQIELNKLVPNKENYFTWLNNERHALEKTIKEQYHNTNNYINQTSNDLDQLFKLKENKAKEAYAQVFADKKEALQAIISENMHPDIKGLLTERVLLNSNQKETISKNNLDQLTAFLREYKHYKMLAPLAKRDLFQKTNIFHNKNLELLSEAFNKTERLQTELLELTNELKLTTLEKEIKLKKNKRTYETYLNNATYQYNTQNEHYALKQALSKNEKTEEIARLEYIIERKKLEFNLGTKYDENKFSLTKEEFSNNIYNNIYELKRELELLLLKRKNLTALYSQKLGEVKSYYESKVSVISASLDQIKELDKYYANMMTNYKNSLYSLTHFTKVFNSVLPYMSERLIDYLALLEEKINTDLDNISQLITIFNNYTTTFLEEKIKVFITADIDYTMSMINDQLAFITNIISNNIEGIKQEQVLNKREINRLMVIIESKEKSINKYLSQLKKLGRIKKAQVKDTEENYKLGYQNIDLELRINKAQLANLLKKENYYHTLLPKFLELDTKQKTLITTLKVTLEKTTRDFQYYMIKFIENIKTTSLSFQNEINQIKGKITATIKGISQWQNDEHTLNKKLNNFSKEQSSYNKTFLTFITDKAALLKQLVLEYQRVLTVIKNNHDQVLSKIKNDQIAISFSRESAYNNELKLMDHLHKDYQQSLSQNKALALYNKEMIHAREKNELLSQIKILNQAISEEQNNNHNNLKIIKLNIEALEKKYSNTFQQASITIMKEFQKQEQTILLKIAERKKKLAQIEQNLEKQFITHYENFLLTKDNVQAKLKKDLAQIEENINSMLFILNDKNEQVRQQTHHEIGLINQKLRKMGYHEKSYKKTAA